jgi:hypothetical protein
MTRNEAYIFFVHHVMKEKSDRQLFHQCASRIDEVVRPIFPSLRDEEKYYKFHFLNTFHRPYLTYDKRRDP